MAAGFTLARPAYRERHDRMETIRNRAARLRESLLELAERDLTAYVPVLEALRIPADDANRGARLDAALSAAAETPLAVAEAAAEVAELAAETACDGNTHLRGDAVTGALLAEAACRSAAHLVETNLAGRPEDVRLDAVAALTQRAACARAKALA
jgi:formiminotetrahydrofolate cyclodeaminase